MADRSFLDDVSMPCCAAIPRSAPRQHKWPAFAVAILAFLQRYPRVGDDARLVQSIRIALARRDHAIGQRLNWV